MSEIQLPPSGLAEDILQEYAQHPEELQVVTFQMGEEYAVPVSQVQEIIRVTHITTVPNSPDHMEGVINIRGKVLPVLNLRKRLRLSANGVDKVSRIIVTEIRGKTIGLLVDAVSHVIKIPYGTIEEAPEEILEVETDYISGVAKLDERLLILLDVERLLRRESDELDDVKTAFVANNATAIEGQAARGDARA